MKKKKGGEITTVLWVAVVLTENKIRFKRISTLAAKIHHIFLVPLQYVLTSALVQMPISVHLC